MSPWKTASSGTALSSRIGAAAGVFAILAAGLLTPGSGAAEDAFAARADMFASAEASAVSQETEVNAGASASSRVTVTSTETCLLAVPAGAPPDGGWPVFVYLHGYGTNKEDFDHVARLTAERGAAAISVDAMSDLGNGRRSWQGGAEEAHTHIQAQLEAMKAELDWNSQDLDRFDFSVLHVGGFSQGGIRSLLLVMQYPDVYGGVLSISPAGATWPESTPALSGTHPLRLIYGTAEGDRVAGTAEKAQKLWGDSGQLWETFTHPGGHHFPGDWPVVLGEGVEWIVETTRSARSEK